MAEWLRRWLDDHQGAPSTVAGYTDHVRRYLDPLLGHLLLKELSVAHVEEMFHVMERWDGVAPATWNRHLSALVSFTAWAQRQELLAANPARRLTRRSRPAAVTERSRAPGWTSC
ncbi:site-specific integrase [Actinomadura sp. 21ATH]